MSAKDHKPTQWGNEVRCIWDHDPWPCDTVKLIAEIRRDIVAEVRPTTPEPMDSEVSFERWQTRMDVAEEIEDGIPEGLKR